MFWANLIKEEADEFYSLIKRVDRWVSYCQSMRAMKPRQEPDLSLDLPDADYLRWDELATKFWTPSIMAVRRTLNP